MAVDPVRTKTDPSRQDPLTTNTSDQEPGDPDTGNTKQDRESIFRWPAAPKNDDKLPKQEDQLPNVSQNSTSKDSAFPLSELTHPEAASETFPLSREESRDSTFGGSAQKAYESSDHGSNYTDSTYPDSTSTQRPVAASEDFTFPEGDGQDPAFSETVSEKPAGIDLEDALPDFSFPGGVNYDTLGGGTEGSSSSKITSKGSTPSRETKDEDGGEKLTGWERISAACENM